MAEISLDQRTMDHVVQVVRDAQSRLFAEFRSYLSGTEAQMPWDMGDDPFFDLLNSFDVAGDVGPAENNLPLLFSESDLTLNAAGRDNEPSDLDSGFLHISSKDADITGGEQLFH
jgi:hypothetical protein